MDLPKFAPSAPLILTSPAVTLASGGSAIADAGALVSPYRHPYLIEEVRFATIVTGSNTFPNRVNYGATISASLKMGRIAVTNGFIPLWNFGPIIQPDYSLLVSGGNEEGGPDFFGNPSFIFANEFRWKLPVPLFMPAGTTLQCGFQRTADTGSDATVWVTYSGRHLEPTERTPAKVAVPWVTCFNPGTSPAVQMSSELDLCNPFLVPVRVQRFIARVAVSLTSPPYENLAYGATGASAGIVQVFMKDSNGNNVIQDPVNILDAFDVSRRAWTFGATLQPKERFNVKVIKDTNAAAYAPMISMIGWREEDFAR